MASIRVHSYESLVSFLEKGVDVRYFFNISSCVQPSSPPPFKDIPVVGGKIRYFSASENSGDDPGTTVFNNMEYIDENYNEPNKEIHTFWIVNDTAKIFWAKPGFFVNNTDFIGGISCDWTKGQGNVWVKLHAQQGKLTSSQEIQTSLTFGDEVGWVVNQTQCQCPGGCQNGIMGDTIRGFKIMKDGSINFSTSMTTTFPLVWNYIRLITFVQVHANNTATFVTRHLDAPTWEQDDIDVMHCPIHSESNAKGARFSL
ncbi:uncharacterized protein LOC133191559 [Saccostrea echinata]|uniref:uncharacterized protein LOC133191559 n=1 Tax=Saccostrea echinata TaxID=191078 RepID=UPI002A82C71D|nr:uncharacterized protein LOC133191559 [Saccostrea echinata]